MAEDEAQRGADFNQRLKSVSFQALRVREIAKHPREMISDVLQEKSIDLMKAIVVFLSSSLVYFQHGFFCISG